MQNQRTNRMGAAVETSKPVGVVLVNWNSCDYTIRCIASLLAATKTPDIMVVVDNASVDGSIEAIRNSFPQVHIIENPDNYGFTGANNIGIGFLLSRGVEFVWILNNDTIVSRDCLQVLMDAMEKHDEVAASTCKIYRDDTDELWFAGSVFQSYSFCVAHRGEGETDHGQYDAVEFLEFLDGCCILARSAALRDVGLFDEHFFAYHEDVDLSFRLRNSGARLLYVPGCSINHFAGASVRGTKRHLQVATSPMQHFLSRRNKLYIVRRYGKIRHLCGCLLLLLINGVYISAAMFLVGRFKKARAVWSGIFHGLLDDISMIKTRVGVTPFR